MWILVLESIFGNGDAGLEKCWINGVYVNGGGGLGTELPLPLFLGGRGGDFLVRRVGGCCRDELGCLWVKNLFFSFVGVLCVRERG